MPQSDPAGEWNRIKSLFLFCARANRAGLWTVRTVGSGLNREESEREIVYSRLKDFWALTEMVQRGKKSAKPQLEVDDSASSLASSW